MKADAILKVAGCLQQDAVAAAEVAELINQVIYNKK
jgi:hypothetical protein